MCPPIGSGRVNASQYRSAYGAYLLAVVLGFVYYVDQLGRCVHLFRVHTVFGKVFHVDFAESAQTRVYGNEGLLNALDFGDV